MIKSIIVVGGGAAGWITAGLIAAKHRHAGHSPITVSLVESPNIPTIGVGEGTWPTMVDTLRKLGISETVFFQRCSATLKQASKFQRWVTGAQEDRYYHPFSPPQAFEDLSLVQHWQGHSDQAFAHAVSLQAHLCDQKRSPKQISSPEYATVENHGYHLDAGKFTELLTEHCTAHLGVKHIRADVDAVIPAENGDIAALSTKQAGQIDGDLFIDCTGSRALLIGKHFGTGFISKKDVLFIDRALAVQVPYADPKCDIESATLSTAQENGWIWDIGLQERRGVGHVFSSSHTDADAAAEKLRAYLEDFTPNAGNLSFREIQFDPGFREKFWVKNCVAVGMAAGFLEPLEASALVMVELAANTIALQLPPHRAAMDAIANRYNDVFRFRWNRIIDFLKLHYVLSQRTDSTFWIDNRDPATIPDSLKEQLTVWKHQAPSNNGFLSPYDLFPAASYQYILCGMGFEFSPSHLDDCVDTKSRAKAELENVAVRTEKLLPQLPTHRAYIEAQLQIDMNTTVDHAKISSDSLIQIDPRQIPALSATYPLFFKRDGATGAFSCVALLGLAQHEQLLEVGSLNAAPSKSPPIAIDMLQRMELLEPVSLEITLDNKSVLKVKGLHVINRTRLQALPASAQGHLKEANQISPIQAMLQSLQHIPTLIDAKNRKLATA